MPAGRVRLAGLVEMKSPTSEEQTQGRQAYSSRLKAALRFGVNLENATRRVQADIEAKMNHE
jgi:hypothetical protein